MLSFPRARDHMQVPQVNALKSCVVEPENQGITAVSISQKLMMEINIKVSSKSEIKRVRNLVPAPAVRLMRRRVLALEHEEIMHDGSWRISKIKK